MKPSWRNFVGSYVCNHLSANYSFRWENVVTVHDDWYAQVKYCDITQGKSFSWCKVQKMIIRLSNPFPMYPVIYRYLEGKQQRVFYLPWNLAWNHKIRKYHVALKFMIKTRMYSSRPRTARLSTISLHELPGGVPAKEGCTCQGGAPAQWGVPAQGGYLPRYSPPVNKMTDRCKNITLPQTSFARGNKNVKSKGDVACTIAAEHSEAYLACANLSLSIIITSFFCIWNPTATLQATFLMC